MGEDGVDDREPGVDVVGELYQLVVETELAVGKGLVSGGMGVPDQELVMSDELAVCVVDFVDKALVVNKVLVVEKVLVVGEVLVVSREELVGGEFDMSGELVVGEDVAGGGCIKMTKVKKGSSSTSSNWLCISSSLGL